MTGVPEPSGPPRAATPDPGRVARISALAWTGIALAVTGQHLLLRALRHSTDSLRADLLPKLVLLGCWALATPGILRSVARWPLHGRRGWRHAAVHFLFGLGFVVGINLLIRLPAHVGRAGVDLTGLGRDLLDGVTFYGPLVLIVYGTIVLTGQWLELRRAADPRAEAPADRLRLRVGDAVRLVPIEAIDHLEADDNYVRVHAGDDVYRVRERLAGLEARLDPARFVRIHRSAIVAIARVRAVLPTRHGDWAVELDTGTRLRVARGRRADLERAIAARSGAA